MSMDGHGCVGVGERPLDTPGPPLAVKVVERDGRRSATTAIEHQVEVTSGPRAARRTRTTIPGTSIDRDLELRQPLGEPVVLDGSSYPPREVGAQPAAE